MSNPGLFKTLTAEGDIAPYRICAPSGESQSATQASSPTAPLMGVTDELGKHANGKVDICVSGLPEVETGGTLAAGDPLTSDADGRAVRATVTGQRVIGFAMSAASAGDIVTFQAAPGFYVAASL